MFTVFSKVEEVWEAQLADIERATKSILMEQYIMEDFQDGGIGCRFIDALTRKRKEGVEVRCILDAQGSFELYKHNPLNDRFTEAGGDIFYYKTLLGLDIVNPARVLLRDHRKLLLIDDEISWIGGVVIGERFRGWDDLMVRYTSPEVASVMNAEFRNQMLRLQYKRSLLAPLTTIDKSNHISGNAPGIGNRFTYEEICHAIMRASESVVLVTPYFAPPIKLQRVMHRRLVDGLPITLIVPQTTDHYLADLARESYMKKFLSEGLTLHYLPRMNHAKVVIVDGLWMTYGSMNLDALSLVFNHELNMTTRDRDLIGEVQELIDAWTDGLAPITLEQSEYHRHSAFERFIGRWVRYIT